MKIFLKYFFVSLLFIALCGFKTYVKYDNVTIAWDAVQNATRYEMKVIRRETGQVFAIASNITDTQVTVERPKSGHFEFQVRACNDLGCSRWSISTSDEDSATENCKEGWEIYWKPSGPTGPIIIQ